MHKSEEGGLLGPEGKYNHWTEKRKWTLERQEVWDLLGWQRKQRMEDKHSQSQENKSNLKQEAKWSQSQKGKQKQAHKRKQGQHKIMCYARKEKRLMAFGCIMHESRKACALICVLSGYQRTRTLYAAKTL